MQNENFINLHFNKVNHIINLKIFLKMKHFTKILIVIVAIVFANNTYAQDTIAAWTFPAGSADSLVDVGPSLNASRYLSCSYGTWNAPTYYDIDIDYSLLGVGTSNDFCAAVSDIDNGADSVVWMVKFKTTGYSDIKFSSKQRIKTNSDKAVFKYLIQYKLSGTSDWHNVTDTVICMNDWVTGAVTDVALPATCDDQSGQISIRWLQISNALTEKKGVYISMLDDIIITGTLSSSSINDDFINTPFFDVYPNPSIGDFVVQSNNNLGNVKVFDLAGKCIFEESNINQNIIKFEDFNKGIYFVNVIDKNNRTFTKKIVIR